jgi:hypothetical protein
VTDVPITDDVENEADGILQWLKAERVDDARPRLSVADTALLRMAAHLLAIGDPAKAREVSDLLDRAPRVVRPGAAPAPRLQDVCKPDCEWDLSRLSNAQLLDLESICACAQGRSSPLRSPRHEALLDLVMHLDGDGAVDLVRVREAVMAIFGSRLSATDVFPDHVAELTAARARCADLEQEVERLRRQLAAVPSNVVALRRDAAAAVTAASALAAVPAPHGFAPHSFVDDHEGYR